MHQVTLTNELIHRGRNTFAVVEVIVQKTLLHHPRLAKALLGRIRSISRANDLISAAAHSGVHLRDLLIQEFEPFGINRLKTLGPNVRIPPLKVRYLILIFHELATNSAKYGSLSNSSGRVIVDWAIVEDVVTINWKEKGGRVVTPAEREGFGTKLIAQSAKSLSAKLSQQFSFDGFGCSLAFRVATDDALISKFRKNRRLYTFKRSESRDHYKGKFDLAVKLEEPQGAWRHGFRRYYSCAAIF